MDCRMKLAAENASNSIVQKIMNAQKFGTERVLEAKERKASKPLTVVNQQNANQQCDDDLQKAIDNSLKDMFDARYVRKAAFEQRLLMQDINRDNKNKANKDK